MFVRRSFRPSRSLVMVLTLLGVSALSGIVLADRRIPVPVDVITSCFNIESGRLRIVDPNAPAQDASSGPCERNEQLLTWNQAGAPGPAGPPGSSGRVVVVVTALPGEHSATANCPPGKSPVGGGAESSIEPTSAPPGLTGSAMFVGEHPIVVSIPVSSSPTLTGSATTGWFARENAGFQTVTTDAPHGFRVYVICMNAAP